MNSKRIAAIGGIAIIASVSACGTTTITKAAATAAATTPPPAATTPPPAATTPTPTTTGPLGTTFTVTGTDNSGNPMSYNVTLDKIVSPAALTPYESVKSGDYEIGAKFTITGDTGTASDNANDDAVAIGSDQQTYTADFSSITAGTNFNSGDWTVRPGQTTVGWVAFALPDSVTLASIQWSPGSNGTIATWTLSK